MRSDEVEDALRAVPRHLFLPGTPLPSAYANDVVVAKRDSASVPISSASQPSMVARMLEQLQVAPGMRILEIGAGTGYNAALLAYLAGAEGHVTTVDVDADLVARASGALANAGFPDVYVAQADGALGYPGGAPYDRVIATVGAWDLPLAWLDQLAPDGRLVVPLRLRGSVTRSIAFERDKSADDRWRSVASEMCSFMPLRGGIADDPGVHHRAYPRRLGHPRGAPGPGCRRRRAGRRPRRAAGGDVDGGVDGGDPGPGIQRVGVLVAGVHAAQRGVADERPPAGHRRGTGRAR